MADYNPDAGRFTILARYVVVGNLPAFGFAIIRRKAYDNSLALTFELKLHKAFLSRFVVRC